MWQKRAFRGSSVPQVQKSATDNSLPRTSDAAIGLVHSGFAHRGERDRGAAHPLLNDHDLLMPALGKRKVHGSVAVLRDQPMGQLPAVEVTDLVDGVGSGVLTG